MVGYAEATAIDQVLPFNEARSLGISRFDRWLTEHDKTSFREASEGWADWIESASLKFPGVTIEQIVAAMRYKPVGVGGNPSEGFPHTD